VVVEKLERGLHTRLKRAGIELVREEVDLSSAKDQGQNLLIATGTRPRVISGTLSTDEALLIDEVPESIVLLGAGAVGIELATYFSQLGSKVELCDLAGQVLPGHISADIVILLQRQLTRARIKLSLNMNSDIDWSAESRLVVSCAGRLVNDRGFFELGLQQDSKGYLLVDEWQKTSQNGIYAAGDVTGQWQLAHAASLAGRRAVQAIIGNKQQQPSAIMPWCVFSDPPLAVVGKLDGPETIMVDFRDLGISQARAETDGVLRAVYDRERQIITGLQILGPGADDLLGAATLLVSQEVPLRDFAQLPWAHPTAVEIFGLLADAIGW
jgi:dihydrolipoamide dehydrogenase